jgi:hypothetical protein
VSGGFGGRSVWQAPRQTSDTTVNKVPEPNFESIDVKHSLAAEWNLHRNYRGGDRAGCDVIFRTMTDRERQEK